MSDNTAGNGAVGAAPRPNQNDPFKEGSILASGKSTPPPAFQFYPRDFLLSPHVRRMSLAERGAYITLLCLSWIDDGVNPDSIQFELGIRATSARKILAGVLGECFEKDETGRLRNPRLEAERQKQKEFREKQATNGSKNKSAGIPKPEPSLSQVSTRARARAEDEIEEESFSSKKEETSVFRYDLALRRLQQDYPQNRITSGHLTDTAFVDAVQRTGCNPVGVVAEMHANLERQKQSHEWRVKGMIPRLDKWLREGLWKQIPEPEKPASPFGDWRPDEEAAR